MTIDLDLLEAAMSEIEQNPEHHDQQAWSKNVLNRDCQTTFCYAGHVAILAGAQPPTDALMGWYVDFESNTTQPWSVRSALFVGEYAQKKLGITEKDADALFHGAATIPQLRVMVDRIKAGLPAALPKEA